MSAGRPTKAHEQVFLLSKRPTYFYDADAIREDAAPSTLADARPAYSRPSNGNQSSADAEIGHPLPTNPAGRNRRSVWTVATQPYAGAHFAVFPPKLIEPCVLAGCPERACAECGAPWVRVTDGATYYEGDDGTRTRKTNMVGNGHGGSGRGPKDNLGASIAQTVGFAPSCGHDAPTVPGTVLDPFAGAGTTGMVALRHGRSFVGVELSAEYADMARWRIRDDAPLLNAFSEIA